MRFWTALILSIFLVGCGNSNMREASRAQGMLDNADLLNEMREFDKAFEEAHQSIKVINKILENSPNNIDFRLLLVRGYMTSFMARNILIIENAPPLPGSLVRLPTLEAYQDYTETAGRAKTLLMDLVNEDLKLSFEQAGYVHGMLAAVLRLQKQTAKDADREYGLAIDAYRSWLLELSENAPRIGSNQWQISKLENQINGLLMARAEVNFLAQNWQKALKMLEEAMAGTDLTFFEVQLPFLGKQIEEVQRSINEDDRITIDPRVERLNAAIARTRKGQLTVREEQAGVSSRRSHLLQLKLEQNQMKNNLLYRIICYYRLGMVREYDEARHILRTHYPEIDNSLESLLK